MKKRIAGIVIIAAITVLVVLFLKQCSSKSQPVQSADSKKGIRYVAIGDSYTIGLGVDKADRWPDVLTGHLINEGIDIHLTANPAVSGYTVNDAVVRELPEVERIRPDFVTVFIGANDNFGQKNPQLYRTELQNLLDKLQPLLTNPKNIVLITLPDYTKSPALKLYEKDNILSLIKQYNQVIKDEGEKRGLPVADIFPVSQTMTGDEGYVADGLHPSAEGYLKWEKAIFPVVFNLLKK